MAISRTPFSRLRPADGAERPRRYGVERGPSTAGARRKAPGRSWSPATIDARWPAARRALSAAILALCAALTPAVAAAQAQEPPEAATQAARDALLDAAEQALAPADDRAAPGADDPRPAARWRFLDGDGVVGVLRLSDVAQAEDGPVGFWVARIVGRGVFEGVYNFKDDGQAAIGVFWREGLLNGEDIIGILDLRVQGERGVGRGTITFIDGGAALEVSAR